MKLCVICNAGYVSRPMSKARARAYMQQLMDLGNYNVEVAHIESEKVTRMLRGAAMQ